VEQKGLERTALWSLIFAHHVDTKGLQSPRVHGDVSIHCILMKIRAQRIFKRPGPIPRRLQTLMGINFIHGC